MCLVGQVHHSGWIVEATAVFQYDEDAAADHDDDDDDGGGDTDDDDDCDSEGLMPPSA